MVINIRLLSIDNAFLHLDFDLTLQDTSKCYLWETQLNPNILEEDIALNKYCVERTDKKTSNSEHSLGGGVCIYLTQNVPFTREFPEI